MSEINPEIKFTSKRLWLAFLVVSIFGVLALWKLTHVPREITPADRMSIERMLSDASISLPERGPDSFTEQIALIRAVQRAVFQASPGTQGIPKEHGREPVDLLHFNHGNCNDRSRSLDKALRYAGFRTRYVSLYNRPENMPVWEILLTSGGGDIRSHALLEVETIEGWMFIDSVSPWIAISKAGVPVSLSRWRDRPDKMDFIWHPQLEAEIYPLLKEDFIHIYGLYSRHGKFYPPYVPVPDINWIEMLHNF